MEQPHSPLNLPLTPLQSAQIEFDKEDLEELAKMLAFETQEAGPALALSLPATRLLLPIFHSHHQYLLH